MSQPRLEPSPLFPEYALGIEQMQHELDEFLANSGLDRLAAAFSTEPLPSDPQERLRALQQIAANHWNYRGKAKAERQAVDWAHESEALTPDQRDAANLAGTELGMAETTAPQERYPDWLLVPGGANKAALDRLAIGLSTVKPRAIAALAGSRKVSGAERESALKWVPAGTNPEDIQTEYDLSCLAIERMPKAQLIGEFVKDRNGDPWRIRMYKFEHDGETREAFVIGAPEMIHDPDGTTRRANSHDNFRCFADGVGARPGMTVAIATTGLYVPMQHLAAVDELAPMGYKVETFGHDHVFSGVKRHPTQYLQEVKSAIDAAASLQAAIARRAGASPDDLEE